MEHIWCINSKKTLQNIFAHQQFQSIARLFFSSSNSRLYWDFFLFKIFSWEWKREKIESKKYWECIEKKIRQTAEFFLHKRGLSKKIFYLKKCVNYNSRQNSVKGPKDQNSAKKMPKSNIKFQKMPPKNAKFRHYSISRQNSV